MTEPRLNSSKEPTAPCDIALIGIACTYAGARDVRQFWHNIISGVDALTDVSPKRWDPEVFYDPDPAAQDRVCCKRGGWIGTSFDFNPLKYGTPPRTVTGAEPDQFLVLRTVYEAIEDAGYLERNLDGRRISFILGRGNYLGAGLTGLLQRGIITEQTLSIIRRLHPDYSAEDLKRIRDALRADLPAFSAEVAPGLIPNLTASRVANRLDFMGSAFTVDAACASSLIATELGMQNLISGRDDTVLVGGAHIFSDLPFMQVFDAMGALSPSATIRPFDRDCDGTIAGEGVGILVLKRLADAQRDGDRIYAVIKGVGVSSDGRAKSVTAPRVEGEELALRRAYESSGVAPETVGLIEAHGTGTPIGDAAEAEALQRVFGPGEGEAPTCAIGSVKSMIGHAMPAAGAAGMIKAALSLYHAVLPPTLNCRQPLESFTRGRFYVNTETRPWISAPARGPRRAGINAFGFGGVNAHVIMEEYRPEGEAERPALATQWDSELLVVEAAGRRELLEALARLQDYAKAAAGIALKDLAFTCNTSLRGEPHRVCFVAGTLEDLAAKIKQAAERLGDPACTRLQDSRGIYFFEDAELRSGKLAMLFPGEGAQYLNMMSGLCIRFPAVRECFDAADQAVTRIRGLPPSAAVFSPPSFSEEETRAAEARLWEIERATEAVLTADGAMYTLLSSLGLRPDMIAGHSAGEWVAMAAAGVFDIDEFVQSMDRLDRMYCDLARNTTIPKMSMLAVGAGQEKVLQLTGELTCSVHIANDNCPHQVVIVTEPAEADTIAKHLLSRGVFVERLPYDRGYHTPAFTYICEPLRRYFNSLKTCSPKVPLYGCTTAAQFPDDPGEIVELASQTFAQPLRFRQTVESLYADGARIFVEAGPRGNLTSFVDDILRGRKHLAVAADRVRKSGTESLHHCLAVLAALNRPLDLQPLYAQRSPRRLSLDPAADAPPGPEPGCMEVSLCYPGLRADHLTAPDPVRAAEEIPAAPGSRLVDAAAENAGSLAGGAAGDPALEQHFQLMEKFLQVQEEVMQAYLGGSALSPGPPNEVLFEPSAPAPADRPPAVPAAEEPSAAANTESEAAAAVPAEDLGQVLLGIVSDRTGYPVEMLDLDVDIEADLGIDSIKRVEILSALREMGPKADGADDAAMEEVARLKTLRQILDYLQRAQGSPDTARLPAGPLLDGMPLIASGEVLRFEPGSEAVIACRASLEDHLYLADHSLDHAGTKRANGKHPPGGLSVIPMTVSVEMMTECAAVLMAPLRAVEARSVQAFKWIDIPSETGAAELVLTAKQIREDCARVTVGRRTTGRPDPETVARAEIVFAADFPKAPEDRPDELKQPRPPASTAAQMYAERRMFHGPRFQGVAALDCVGADGLSAQLEVLPTGNLLATNAAPEFIVDPFLLDAAGQLVGYWPVEYLSEGFVLFPIRIESLQLYRANPHPGQRAPSQLRIRSVSRRQLKADLDILDSEGRLWMRVRGWEDWRFYWPRSFYDFWRFPNLFMNSRPVQISLSNGFSNIVCCRLDTIPEMDNGVWEDLWAHIILSSREMETYRRQSGAERSRWIHGRAVAKDAARSWLKAHHGTDVYPAEIEIISDADGRAQAAGEALETLSRPLRVCVAWGAKAAVAVAGDRDLGICLTLAGEPAAEFLPEEERLLEQAQSRNGNEWIKLAGCAKQAAASMKGLEAEDALRGLCIQDLNVDEGTFRVAAGPAGESQADTWLVRPAVDDGLVVAVAVKAERMGANAEAHAD